MTAVLERRNAEGWLWIDVEHVSQSYLHVHQELQTHGTGRGASRSSSLQAA